MENTPAAGGGCGDVLVVDDDPDMQEVLRYYLEKQGFSVTLADNGEAALLELDRSPGVRLVITDYNMPGMNGHDLARVIKSARPGVPVLLLTGFGEVRGSGNPDGVDLVLRKPVTGEVLARAMTQLQQSGSGGS